MTRAFLFCHDFNATHCDYVVIDDSGNATFAQEQISLEQVKPAQTEQTMVVLPGRLCSLFHVQLPLLSEKKARQAIPYALEEKIAQDLNEVHFAFATQDYHNGRYLVASIDKNALHQLQQLLTAQGIHADKITLDWFALHPDEVLLTHDGLLLNAPEFNGFVSHELENTVTGAFNSEKLRAFSCKDSISSAVFTKPEQKIETVSHWLAQRLANKRALNLLQGELAVRQTGKDSRPWLIAALACGLLWLVSVFAVMFWQSIAINKQIEHVDKQIASIYFKFFPDAKTVISPRFRITQKLKEGQNASDKRLFVLLNALVSAQQKIAVDIEQIRYQNKKLQATLSSSGFQTIEEFQNALAVQGLKVKQIQATTKDNSVYSIVELTL